MDQNIMSDDQQHQRHQRPVILCLSATGLPLATHIAAAVDGDVHGLAGRCDAAICFPHFKAATKPKQPRLTLLLSVEY